MADPTGEIGYLKHQIMTVISQHLDTVQDVADYEKVGFEGFPAVTVVCSGNQNEAYSSVENQRTFNFTIRIYVQIGQEVQLDQTSSDDAKQDAEKIMERVVDQLLAAFDTTTNFTLDDAADNGVDAVPSQWGYALLPAGWCRTAEVNLQVKRTYLVQ